MRVEVSAFDTRNCRIPLCENELTASDPSTGRHANMCSECRRGRTVAVQAYQQSRGVLLVAAPPTAEFTKPARPTAGGELTGIELEVLSWIAEGLANEEIAVKRGRSKHTILVQTRTMFEKLGARNRAHAVAIAFRQGLLA